jgi:uncharacterized protein YhaN
MYIKKIHISDFGIIRNQTLNDILPGIVVIGGFNRAGKSTFMEVLKNLAWGFPKNLSIPSSSGKYEIAYDLETEKGVMYNIRIIGYGEPSINIISETGNKVSNVQELYVIDKFTYQQLFTINLGQLRKIPENVNSMEARKLNSVLLGAGLEEIIHIPGIENEFVKEADKIGGKNGNPEVKQFKSHYEQIKNGITLKQEALAQVEKFIETRKKLSVLEHEIADQKQLIEKQKARTLILDIMRTGYNDYRTKEEYVLKFRDHEGRLWVDKYPVDLMGKAVSLKEEYEKLLDDSKKLKYEFKYSTDQDNVEGYMEKLLKSEKELIDLQRMISGLRVRIENYLDDIKEYSDLREDISLKMKKISNSWSEKGIEFIKQIPTGDMEENYLNEDIKLFERYSERLETEKIRAQGIRAQREFVEKQLKKQDISEFMHGYIRFVSLILVISVTAAAALYFVHPYLGFSAVTAGLTVVLMHYVVKMKKEKIRANNVNELQTQIDNLNLEIKKIRFNSEELEEKISNIKKSFSKYASVMGITGEFPAGILKDRLKNLRDLQEMIFRYENYTTDANKLFMEIKRELEKYDEVLKKISGRQEKYTVSSSNVKDYSEKIFDEIENLNENLKKAKDLKKAGEKVKEIEKRVIELTSAFYAKDDNKETDGVKLPDVAEMLNKFIDTGGKVNDYIKLKESINMLGKKTVMPFNMQRNREAFLSTTGREFNSEEEILEGIGEHYKQFASADEIENEYNEFRKRLNKSQTELDKLKEEHMNMKRDMEELKKTANLEIAQRQIDEARSGLKQLAVKYSSYRAAAFILKNIQKNFMNKMKDTILAGAQEVFANITGGEYEGLNLPELSEPEFNAVLKDGKRQQAVDILSRGTCEQLYMAVRISRIMDIKPSLPVVIDDSFVNFDVRHIRNSLQIIYELSKSRQIFILTCHPELIREIGGQKPDAQYWILKNGQFEISDCKELAEYLSYI